MPPGPRRSCGFTAGWPWSGSRPRARSAGTRRGRSANGRARTRSPLFELFWPTPSRSARSARAKGPSRWVNALAHRLRDNAPRKAQGEHRRALRPRQRFLFGLARRDDDLQLGALRSGRTSPRRRAAAQGPLLLDRLDLKPGQRLLEIGCGWGTLAIEAARRGAIVVGLTFRPSRRTGPSARSPRPGCPTASRSACRIIATSTSSSTPSRRSRWSRRSAQRWWGAYLDCIARNLKPGGRAALQFICIGSPPVRPLRAQCRLHPDLHLSRRHAARRAGVRGLARGARPRLAGPRRLRRSIMPTRSSAGATATTQRSPPAHFKGSTSHSTVCGAII